MKNFFIDVPESLPMSMPQEDLFIADQILRQAVLMLELHFKIVGSPDNIVVRFSKLILWDIHTLKLAMARMTTG